MMLQPHRRLTTLRMGVFVRLPFDIIARSRMLMEAARLMGLPRLTWGAMFVRGMGPTELDLQTEAARRGMVWADLIVRSQQAAARRRRVESELPAILPGPISHTPHARIRPTGYFPEPEVFT